MRGEREVRGEVHDVVHHSEHEGNSSLPIRDRRSLYLVMANVPRATSWRKYQILGEQRGAHEKPLG